jgi:predicted helicase
MLPRHAKSSRFLGLKLFDRLDSFGTLERRIADLPKPKERGDAFEVFVEAYLCTQANRQAAEVWPQVTAPSRVLNKLNLRTPEHGYDGVYRTLDGDYVAYQVKFRTGRKSLPFGELATFFGSTDNESQRVLFANSDRISEIAEERPRFHWSRGADFDRLEQDDFKRILTWLKTGQVKLKTRTPDRHQREALKAIRKKLTDNDRANVIMACGTGKTLVSLWAAEQSEPRSVIVLLPSLALGLVEIQRELMIAELR